MKLKMKMFDTESKVAILEGSAYEGVLSHSHDFNELVYVRSGRAINCIDDQIIKIENGDIFLIPMGKSHYIRPISQRDNIKYINIIFKPEDFDMDLTTLDPFSTYNFFGNQRISNIIESMLGEYNEQDAFYDDINLANLSILFFEIMRETQPENSKSSKKRSQRLQFTSYIDLALDYIHTNYDQQIRLSDIAKYVGLYEGYLQKLFREERKTSIREYLTAHRLQQACRMLSETDLSVQDICQNVGYSDLKNFYVLFKNKIGTTPAKYREHSKI